MILRLLAASALAGLALSACSQGETPPASDAAAETDNSAQPTKAPAPAENTDGPQVGDRVPEPDTSGDDRSVAEQAAAEKAKSEELAARGVTEIGWEELMPEGEEERFAELYQQQMARAYSKGISEGSSADTAVQIGTFNTVDEIMGQAADGMKIRLPGYTVPFEYGKNAEINEFLLVPYYGACLHAPPPPPNQTVFVKTEDAIQLKDLSQAVWIEGTLRVQKQTSDLADAAYTIEMTGWEIYEY
ncbi:DUF3299 domain-containing protein [Henriciella aquimarina]|uniref:DUF3299 domain-containing protein n=1 Tax=Henriciella aquimarina TaxID=545261 RepID=UPI000A078D96|nr:DUF3299 domain-containing protein [Henriciella aquimarina]